MNPHVIRLLQMRRAESPANPATTITLNGVPVLLGAQLITLGEP